VIASVAYDDQRDASLVALDAGHLFATNTTRIAIKRGAFLRAYVFDFIRTFAAPLTREVVERALASAPGEVVEI
jgi:LysR family transcriptional regulator, cys regulon transcriptional activator